MYVHTYLRTYEVNVFSSGLAFCCDLSLPFCDNLTLTIQYLAYIIHFIVCILF